MVLSSFLFSLSVGWKASSGPPRQITSSIRRDSTSKVWIIAAQVNTAPMPVSPSYNATLFQYCMNITAACINCDVGVSCICDIPGVCIPVIEKDKSDMYEILYLLFLTICRILIEPCRHRTVVSICCVMFAHTQSCADRWLRGLYSSRLRSYYYLQQRSQSLPPAQFSFAGYFLSTRSNIYGRKGRGLVSCRIFQWMI